MQFSEIYAPHVHSCLKFILVQFLISSSYKVNYFDFALFQILLKRTKFISSVSCLWYIIVYIFVFDQGFQLYDRL